MKKYQKIFKGTNLKEAQYQDFGKLFNYFVGDEYKDYRYGNPKLSAKNIWDDTIQYLDNLQKNLDLAGEYLAPAIKNAVLDILKKNIERYIKTK